MSLRSVLLAIAASSAVSSGPALSQDAGFGLRRLSPPTPATQTTRRATPATPAPKPATTASSATTAATPGTKPAPVAGVPPYRRTAPPIGGPATPTANRPVIIIDSRRIGDPNGAVIEVSRASRQVVQEFAARTQELVKLKAEAEKTQTAADAAKGRDKTTLAAQARLQKADFDTRDAALEKQFKARSETLLAPIQVRINDALKAFAVANGALIVLDGARFNGAVLAMQASVDPASLDLTTVFIDGYNKAHP